jgi:RNA polymerase sigma factor (sigma-70 family)
MEDLTNCLYDKDEKRWIKYTEEEFLKEKKKRNKERKKAVRDRRCVCSYENDWYCNASCEGCMYQVKREKSIYDTAKRDSTLSLEECITDNIDPEKDWVECMDFKRILLRLDEIMPEARKIGRLRIQGKSEDEIAQCLGVSRATIYRRIKAAYQVLSKEFE